MNSFQPINRKARKMEESRVAETGDVQALQDNATKVTVREGAAASVNLILARR